MFGEVIGAIEFAFAPDNVELALADSVANPVKTHVHGFGALLFDGIVGDASGGAVVGDDDGRWLLVAEFLKTSTDGTGFLGIVEEASKFGFGGGRDDFAENLARDMNGAVDFGTRVGGSGRIREKVEACVP